MENFLQKMKPLVVTLLALVAPIVVTLGAIQLRVWLSGNPTSGNNSAVTVLSHANKLAILASLSSSTSTGPTNEEKVKILGSIH